MKFPRQFLDTLKERINISEVVGQKVALKHKARGEFTGLCPFHNEKTPSFTVSDAKGFYHCFGCGAHGTAYNFLMEQRGLTFGEAVKELAQIAGVQLPKMEEQDVAREKEVQDSFTILEATTAFFQERLYSEEGKKALEYLHGRGLTDETIKHFRLGYSPERREALYLHLTKLGADPELIEANGLCIKSDKTPANQPAVYFDRFRGRVIFPIFDSKTRPIAFGGRIMDKVEGVAKYLNSPETDLFKKGYVLYAYNFARDIAFKKQNVAVVEGYMDVIALHQAGIKNVVAPLGTAVTENHLKALWRITKDPVFCLDGDTAGFRAMKRLAEEFITILEPGYSMNFVNLPEGRDPDEIIKNGGLNSIRQLLGNAKPLSQALWEANLEGQKLDTPEKKAAFENKLINIAKTIKNQEVSKYYLNYFKTKFYEDKYKTKKVDNKKSSIFSEITSIHIKTTDAGEKLRTTLLLIIYKNPELLADGEIENYFSELHIQNKNLQIIHDKILDLFFTHPDGFSHQNVRSHLEKSGLQQQITYAESLITKDYYYKEDQPRDLIISAWNYFLLNNNLEETKKEYINFTSLDEVDFEKAASLKHEMEILEKKLLEERKNFETLQEKLTGEL